jgi:choline monooxygenase
VDIVGEPLIIVRDRDRELRALSAVCRHRGTCLVAGQGNARSFTCPYHGWTYALSGRLLGTPFMEQVERMDRDQYGLKAFALEEWEGFVFVNLGGSPAPLAAHLAPLSGRLVNFKLNDMVLTKMIRYDIQCNWKLFVENNVEGYHVDFLHKSIASQIPSRTWLAEPRSNGAYDVLTAHRVVTSRTFSGKNVLPEIPGLSDTERNQLSFYLIYPSFVFTPSPTGLAYFITLPDGPARARVILGMCFPRATTRLPDFEALVAEYYERFDVVVKEDIATLESAQRGLSSRFARSGRYALLEELLHRFHSYVIAHVRGTESDLGQRGGAGR